MSNTPKYGPTSHALNVRGPDSNLPWPVTFFLSSILYNSQLVCTNFQHKHKELRKYELQQKSLYRLNFIKIKLKIMLKLLTGHLDIIPINRIIEWKLKAVISMFVCSLLFNCYCYKFCVLLQWVLIRNKSNQID